MARVIRNSRVLFQEWWHTRDSAYRAVLEEEWHAGSVRWLGLRPLIVLSLACTIALVWPHALWELVRNTGFTVFTLRPQDHVAAEGKPDVWDLAERKSVGCFCGHSGPVTCIALSHDGNWVASGSADHTVAYWNASDGLALHRFGEHPGPVSRIVLSATGTYVVFVSSDVAVLRDLRSGEELWRHQRPSSEITFVAVSEDERWVLLVHGSSLSLRDLKTGAKAQAFLEDGATIRQACFSPDGQYVLTGRDDGGGTVWEVRTGKSTVRLGRHDSAVTLVGWARNGLQAWTGAGDTFRLWYVTERRHISSPVDPPNEFGDAWYDEVLRHNPRVAVTNFKPGKRERVFLTALLPQEAEKFAAWLGDGFGLPSVALWREVYQAFGKRPFQTAVRGAIVQRTTEKSPVAGELLAKLWEQVAPRTPAEALLLKHGVVEWVRDNGHHVGLGVPRREFHANLWDPLEETVKPLSPDERIHFFGFRLWRTLTPERK